MASEKLFIGMVECSRCGRCVAVVWLNDGTGGPEFCPMCGCEWEYSEAKPEGGE